MQEQRLCIFKRGWEYSAQVKELVSEGAETPCLL